MPNFVISFLSLTLFCIFCSFTFLPNSPKSFLPIDWIRSKPYVACAGQSLHSFADLKIPQKGLFNTILALMSAFGLLLLLGVPYNVINTIIPFLVNQ